MTSKCPDLGTATPTASFSFDLPNSAVGSPAEIVAGTDYLTNPSTTTVCAVVYSLVQASDGTTAVGGTWLSIDSGTGVVKVDKDTLGDETVKVKYVQAGSGTDTTSSQF